MNVLKPPRLPEGDQTTTLRRYGQRIQYDPNSYIGKYLHYHRLFEGEILRSIEEHLRPGGTFWTSVPTLAQHTLVAAALVGAQGRVISFEPGVKQRREAHATSINGLKNVDVRPYGLSREAGSHELFHINISSMTANPRWPSLKRPRIVSLKSCSFARSTSRPPMSAAVSMKIDVEGAGDGGAPGRVNSSSPGPGR